MIEKGFFFLSSKSPFSNCFLLSARWFSAKNHLVCQVNFKKLSAVMTRFIGCQQTDAVGAIEIRVSFYAVHGLIDSSKAHRNVAMF